MKKIETIDQKATDQFYNSLGEEIKKVINVANNGGMHPISVIGVLAMAQMIINEAINDCIAKKGAKK